MRVTKWGEYGILCCLELAKLKDDDTAGAAEIAAALEIQVDYAQQVLHRLRKCDVISSVRGPGGGYRLARPPAEINLREILYAAEGDTLEIICDKDVIYSNCSKDARSCGLRSVWHELKVAIDGLLEQRTLADLMLRAGPSETLVSLTGKS